jgi:hypothetical protein
MSTAPTSPFSEFEIIAESLVRVSLALDRQKIERRYRSILDGRVCGAQESFRRRAKSSANEGLAVARAGFKVHLRLQILFYNVRKLSLLGGPEPDPAATRSTSS